MFGSDLLFFAFIIIGTLLFLGVLSPNLEAQKGEETKYPVISDKDFKLYLDFVDLVNHHKDPMEFIKTNNVSSEYLLAVHTKIFANFRGRQTGNMEDIVSKYGKNILFNESETAIYKKYEEQLVAAIIEFDEKR
ncbi:MAG: hypothetical protein LBD41_04285 [Clostridiales Family XIII bacterium]|jgi:hypothetical protein|nr:hypothetical protein [Clostridiales Family XIII bacterium]